MPDPAANVAGVYVSLRDDIVHGTATSPGFADALKLTRMVDAVLRSSEEGRRIAADGWSG